MIARLLPLTVTAMLCAAPAIQARAEAWTVTTSSRDLEIRSIGKSRPSFSARAYAASLAPSDFAPVEGSVVGACTIEISIQPLSIIGNVFSFAVTYRRLPGDCTPPLRNGGYHVVRAVHLSDGRVARLDDLPDSQGLLEALRATRQVRDLLGSASATSATFAELFQRLDKATMPHCERRLTEASRSAFYAVSTSFGGTALRLAYDNACGELSDEPAVDSFALPLPPTADADVVVLNQPAAVFRFLSPPAR